MFYKLFKEDGEYLQNGEPANLLEANQVFLPEGAETWDEFDNIDEAIKFYNAIIKACEKEITQ